MGKDNGEISIYNLHMHTCQRKYMSELPSNCSFDLFQEFNNVINIKLLHIELPSTWYMITENNNSFKIKFNFNPSFKDNTKDDCGCSTDNSTDPFSKSSDMPSEIDIVLESGNYSIDQFTVVLNGLLKNIPKSCKEHIQIRAEFNEINLKYKLCVEFLTGKVESINVCFVEGIITRKKLCTSLGWLMGYRKEMYTINSDVFSLENTGDKEICIESEGLFNAAKDRYVYFALRNEQICDNTNKICLSDQLIENCILGKIVIHDGAFSIIMHDYDDKKTALTSFLKKVKRFRQLSISILDEYGDVVDMNNMDFSFTLQFTVIYNYAQYS